MTAAGNGIKYSRLFLGAYKDPVIGPKALGTAEDTLKISGTITETSPVPLLFYHPTVTQNSHKMIEALLVA